MTHVTVPTEFTEPTVHTDIYGDGIGYTESYDFSRANLSNETRIAAISQVASICYQSPKAAGSISLYNRLANESAGLPSSSFEFVPVLLKLDSTWLKTKDPIFDVADPTQYQKVLRLRLVNCFKYGETVTDTDDDAYLLTNLRALLADVGDQADQFFNTEAECEIIAKHFKVFKWKIPLFVARQAMRHRCSWQELSRRYVSGSKSQFEFYLPEKLLNSEVVGTANYGPDHFHADIKQLHQLATTMYNALTYDGIKPELARTVLPQSMYTTVWSAWQPSQLDVFYKLRLDSHAQLEIRQLAQAMKGN